MEIGMIGMGRMGGNMAERLRRADHTVVGYDRNLVASDVCSLEELLERLSTPRVVWVMVPAGAATQATIDTLSELLSSGDIVVDGGNSRYSDDQIHAELLAKRGIGFVDAGVSGGIWGLENGYALMVGGNEEHVKHLMPVFEALKPPGEYGFAHAGEAGAGHFAKMVHNGIEYGMMQAFAEGWELLQAADLIKNVPAIFRSWREGTVIRSWLLDLADRALDDDPDLAGLKGIAQESGEARWMVEAAVEKKVPLPVIAAALFARFTSQQGGDSPAMKMVAALRNQFGGHATLKNDDPGTDTR